MAGRKIECFCYRAFSALVGLILSPVFILRMIINFRTVETFFQSGLSSDNKPVIWAYIASKRQLPAARRFIRELSASYPGCQLVITAKGINTDSLRGAVGQNSIIMTPPYPVEFCSKAIVSKIKPRLLLIFEDWLLPNTVRDCGDLGCKVVLINGRVNRKARLLNRLLPGLVRIIVKRFDLLVMGTVAEANRIGELGAVLRKIAVAGIEPQSELEADTGDKRRDNDTELIRQIIDTIGSILENRTDF